MLEAPRCDSRSCVHLLGAYQPDDTEAVEVPCCVAFPRGIPREISYGDNLHLEPVPGDHGIQYERDYDHGLEA